MVLCAYKFTFFKSREQNAGLGLGNLGSWAKYRTGASQLCSNTHTYMMGVKKKYCNAYIGAFYPFYKKTTKIISRHFMWSVKG